MARFRGTVQGSRGEASRLGRDGLTTTCNGWRVGANCHAVPVEDHWLVRPGESGVDAIWIYATRGSGGLSGSRPIGVLIEHTKANQPPAWIPSEQWPSVVGAREGRGAELRRQQEIRRAIGRDD